MPATDCANGTTFKWGAVTTHTKVRDVTFDSDGNVVDTTNMADTSHAFCGGLPSDTMTVELIGTSTLSVGDTATSATFTWPDASTDVITDVRISSKSVSGSIDNPVLSSITIVRDDA